jgi:hypothetical protein
VSDLESITLYRARWSLLKQMAVYGDEARTFLAIVASGLRKRLDLNSPHRFSAAGRGCSDYGEAASPADARSIS